MQEGQRFGPYELIKRIAYGGMAEIHLARASGIGGFEKLLALKVIHPKFSTDQEFIDMLVDEAKIAVQLSHVNVGQIFDLGRIEDTYYIAMEFIDGKDLYQLLVKCSELEIEIPFDIIVFIAMEAAAGLQYAHTKADNYGRPLNIVHRDISPQNVLISYDGEVKIVDFGIAKASQRSKETESGVIKGKFFYMSPEQAWGDRIDARTDIFSTGICLYEMITGEMLYNEEKALALLDKVRKAEIPPMRARRRDLPPALEGIILKALARDRDKRYQSAGELQRALSAFLYSNWPDFNRGRVKAFMRQVFGDQRFVLPMPAGGRAAPQLSIEAQAPAPKEEVVDLDATGSLMSADDYDKAPAHSVIFDLGHFQAARSAGPAEDDGDPTVNAGGVYLPDDDDDDADNERTIAEVVWSPGDPLPQVPRPQALHQLQPADDDDEDATSVIGAGAIEAVRAMVSGGDRPTTEEPPTSLFNRDGGLPAPGRAHRPVQPTAGSNVPLSPAPRGPVPPARASHPPPAPDRPLAAADLPAMPPPNMPPMPPGPMPPAPTPIQAPSPPKPIQAPPAVSVPRPAVPAPLPRGPPRRRRPRALRLRPRALRLRPPLPRLRRPRSRSPASATGATSDTSPPSPSCPAARRPGWRSCSAPRASPPWASWPCWAWRPSW
ncbi:MAG: protein kinase [Myxococcales bacterium]|nr:protein kinase [Myxococcales bacterium]